MDLEPTTTLGIGRQPVYVNTNTSEQTLLHYGMPCKPQSDFTARPVVWSYGKDIGVTVKILESRFSTYN